MLGVVGEQIDAGLALILLIVIEVRPVRVEGQIFVVGGITGGLLLVVRIGLKIAIGHQVIGGKERLGTRLTYISGLSDGGAGDGDTSGLLSCIP